MEWQLNRIKLNIALGLGKLIRAIYSLALKILNHLTQNLALSINARKDTTVRLSSQVSKTDGM